MRYIFHPFFGIRKLATGRFHRRGVGLLSCATIIFASHRTISGCFGLTGRVHVAVPRSVGCFYIVRAVTLCVRGCMRCHGHGIFFNSANGVSKLVTRVDHRGKRGCLIPLDDMRGSSIGGLLSRGGLGRARYIVCHAMDGSFARRRVGSFSCSVVVFFDPAKMGTLGGGFPGFRRNGVTLNTFNPTAVGAMASRNLHVSLRTPAGRFPSVAKTLGSCLGQGGGWRAV